MMIEHLSIQGMPVMEIITETKPGPNKGVQYAISYDEHSKIESSLNHYRLEQENFTLDEILDSYFCHYGLKKATEILLEKEIIAYGSCAKPVNCNIHEARESCINLGDKKICAYCIHNENRTFGKSSKYKK